ncbi:MAG TPA: FtsW/RodA/SpoVE family cell cycle protein, partial [Acidimicrobiales bacterium]|nr:FtsW/RodA/SpoVE family cell cycle protein [Acidimicrobiales bacterium]
MTPTSTRSIGLTQRHAPPRPRRTTATKKATAAPRPSAQREAARTAGIGIRIGSRRLSVSTLLLVDVVLLCLIGLVMVGSASSVISIATYGSPWAILIREAMWMAIGGIALWLAVRFDYRKLRRFSPLILLVTFGLLFVVLVPGLGVHAMGS